MHRTRAPFDALGILDTPQAPAGVRLSRGSHRPLVAPGGPLPHRRTLTDRRT